MLPQQGRRGAWEAAAPLLPRLPDGRAGLPLCRRLALPHRSRPPPSSSRTLAMVQQVRGRGLKACENPCPVFAPYT